EDGIRDLTVTGVQTCALPILSVGCVPASCARADVPAVASINNAIIRTRFIVFLPRSCGGKSSRHVAAFSRPIAAYFSMQSGVNKIGRASCRERVDVGQGAVLG